MSVTSTWHLPSWHAAESVPSSATRAAGAVVGAMVGCGRVAPSALDGALAELSAVDSGPADGEQPVVNTPPTNNASATPSALPHRLSMARV
ncbi:hypothetical protein O7627_18275 [Solwaraspora sp. WMMD1047]|uniref:hypothetical protein n=1 Tax=Solwaraspora sp. WMMD1047 TaxID=3016102 RepID=UPI002415B45E|nr:hypothetical protein [Solwaraspora sp. WMMD1047]MDG4831246.1 hypothetical protein [Solwaraspora sp. WMMD1047]